MYLIVLICRMRGRKKVLSRFHWKIEGNMDHFREQGIALLSQPDKDTVLLGYFAGSHLWRISVVSAGYWLLYGVSDRKEFVQNSFEDPTVWGIGSGSQVYYHGEISTEDEVSHSLVAI